MKLKSCETRCEGGLLTFFVYGKRVFNWGKVSTGKEKRLRAGLCDGVHHGGR